jgi:hypothetical protein
MSTTQGKRRQAPTVAEHLASYAPFHKAANAGIKIREEREHKVLEKEVLSISGTTLSGVDSWMQEMEKTSTINPQPDYISPDMIGRAPRYEFLL